MKLEFETEADNGTMLAAAPPFKRAKKNPK